MVKNRTHKNRPRPVGLLRRGDVPTACGLCGTLAKMTRAHVPPQCAGNEGLVARVRLQTDQHSDMRRGKARHGGMYVFGLCESCNGLASKWDAAYCELAWALEGLWPRDLRTQMPRTVSLPAVDIRPGTVARSLLIGMCAINPNIRTTHPALPAALLGGGPATLPSDMRLRVALCRSNRARISGAISGLVFAGPYAQPLIDGKPPGVAYDAAVHFPPLAWALTRNEKSILDRQGYGDASTWLTYDPNDVVNLAALLPELPYADYPQHDPALGPYWSEVLSDQISEIVETDSLPRGVLRPTS
jgi:hypothetical protein